jgi:hypothetical protein
MQLSIVRDIEGHGLIKYFFTAITYTPKKHNATEFIVNVVKVKNLLPAL